MQKTLQGFLTIVMPVYNEEAVIEKVVDDFASIAKQFSKYEYIIIDDGSTDRTSELLNQAQSRYPFLSVIQNRKNRGHAQSLLAGLMAAKGDFVFCCDSDNQFYAEDFWVLWKTMQEKDADGVLGYRPYRQDSFHRLIIAALLKIFVFLLFGMSIRDSASSFRLYTRDALSRILSIIPREPFFIFPLMSVVGFKCFSRVYEVPVRHLPRITGVTYIRHWNIARICFQAAKELVVFKRRLSARSSVK